jgi:endonuclease G
VIVNEQVVRETEKRAVAKGPASAVNRVTADVEIDLSEAALGPELTSAAAAAPGTRRIRIPRDRLRVPSREGQTPAEVRERLRHASFAGAVPSDAEFERFIGENDLVDENYLERALVAARAVCRLVFKDENGRQAFATGFMVSPQLLLTNWHVFPVAKAAAGAVAEFDYKLDIRGLEVTPTRFQVLPNVCYRSNQELDFALLAVAPKSLEGGTELTSFGYHRLVEERGKLAKNEPITIIQHPAGGRRQIALRENELVEEPSPEDLFLWYRSDTAKGSSGAPAFNDSWQIVALHHSGKARKENGLYVLRNGQRVASLKGIDETDVDWLANEGLRASVLCRALRDEIGDSALGKELIAAMEGDGDIMARSLGARESLVRADGNGGRSASLVPANGAGLFPGVSSLEFNAAQINLAHQIVIQSASAPGGYGEARRPDDAIVIPARRVDPILAEKFVEPIVDRKYSNRRGYVQDFLGISAPLPTLTDKKSLAKMDDGSPLLPYQHFTVVMNKKRRLALLTASNVDASAKARKPEPDRPDSDYTRDGLTGLGKNDDELWITDPRIPEEHQLPDVFYTKDRQSFDKGHIVRREDVCWGRSYAMVRRANGDTFHTTNCSPQVKEFNRSNLKGKWGELENIILKQAKTERLAVFAGPVLDDDDDPFEGVDERGAVSVQIPRRYWKIVLAKAGNALQAFGFILDQDLSNVSLEPEFAVDPDWVGRMIAIPDLQDLTIGIAFDPSFAAADQIHQQDGDEVAVAAEIAKI